MAKSEKEYRDDIARHTQKAAIFLKSASVTSGVRHDEYIKRAHQAEMSAIIIGETLAEMLAESERTADGKTDGKKNLGRKHRRTPPY